MRLRDRFISRQDSIDSVNSYEIIEEYPHDKYLPSYLVYSIYHDVLFHVSKQVIADSEIKEEIEI